MIVSSVWRLTPLRAAVHIPSATAVVADLHIGYGAARRRRGDAVPLDDLGPLFAALADLRDRHGVRRLVVAGDLCEDAAGRALIPELLSGLAAVGVDLMGVVPGNHDRGLERDSAGLPLFPEGVRVGDWLVRHGDGALPAGRLVLGHFHPCLRLAGARAACFLVGEERLVLPAFSADAAGTNVAGAAAWQGYRAVAIVGGDLLDFGDAARLR